MYRPPIREATARATAVLPAPSVPSIANNLLATRVAYDASLKELHLLFGASPSRNILSSSSVGDRLRESALGWPSRAR